MEVRSIWPMIAPPKGLASCWPSRPLACCGVVVETQQAVPPPPAPQGCASLGLPSTTFWLNTRRWAIALHGPGRRDVDLAGEIEIADLVGGDLGIGIDRAVILRQQFDRDRGGGAELVVGGAHVEVEFVAFEAVADIAVEAADVGFRECAKSAVVQSFERAIDGKIVDLLAPLRRALQPPERATQGVDLGAMIAEAILHLDVQRAAERIEAEGGIVGDDAERADRLRSGSGPS